MSLGKAEAMEVPEVRDKQAGRDSLHITFVLGKELSPVNHSIKNSWSSSSSCIIVPFYFSGYTLLAGS